MIKFFRLGFLFGFLFWSFSILWIYDAINFYGAGTFLSSLLTFLLIAYLSCYFGLFGMAVHFFKDHKYRLFLIPSSFFLLEWVKSWMISGFPWLNLGIIFESLWGLLPIVGVSGTSFVMLLIICAILEKNIYVKTVVPILFTGLLLFGPGHYQKISEDNSDLTVTVVQPANLGLDGLIELTNKADSNIVVWPEASAWYTGNAFSTDKRIIGGFFRREESKTFTAVIDASNGEGYNKHNLVPFGEFQPFGDLLIGINSFFNIPNSRISRGAFVQDKLNWSGLVCWELVFNNTFIERVKGTEFIIHVSNDSWYGSSMPAQHLKHARARSVESNKWVVRSTTDGLSQIISPQNEQSSKLLNRKEYGSITHTIKANTDDTIYLKIGDWPILIFSLLACLMGYIFRGNNEN